MLHQFVSSYFAVLSLLGRIKESIENVSEKDDPIDPTHDHVHDKLVINQGL